jgi:hypothetical protein
MDTLICCVSYVESYRVQVPEMGLQNFDCFRGYVLSLGEYLGRVDYSEFKMCNVNLRRNCTIKEKYIVSCKETFAQGKCF